MKKKRLTARRVNAIVASAMAVTLAIPSTAFFGKAQAAYADDAAEEVELPEPIAFYDFERGLKEAGTDASGEALAVTVDKSETVWEYYESDKVSGAAIVHYNKDGDPYEAVIGNQPLVTNDEEKGNVFTLLDSITTKKAYTEPIASISSDGVTGLTEDGKAVQLTDKTQTTAYSGATIDNPFAGRTDLVEDRDTLTFDSEGHPVWNTGVTVSYWVKAPAAKDADGNVVTGENSQVSGQAIAKDSSILSFESNTISGLDAIQKDDAGIVRVSKQYLDLYNAAIAEGKTDAQAKEVADNNELFTLGDVAGSVDLKAKAVSTPLEFTDWSSAPTSSAVKVTVKDEAGKDKTETVTEEAVGLNLHPVNHGKNSDSIHTRRGWEWTFTMEDKANGEGLTTTVEGLDVGTLDIHALFSSQRKALSVNGPVVNAMKKDDLGVKTDDEFKVLTSAQRKELAKTELAKRLTITDKDGNVRGNLDEYMYIYIPGWSTQGYYFTKELLMQLDAGDIVTYSKGEMPGQYKVIAADKENGKVKFQYVGAIDAEADDTTTVTGSLSVYKNYGRYAAYNSKFDANYYGVYTDAKTGKPACGKIYNWARNPFAYDMTKLGEEGNNIRYATAENPDTCTLAFNFSGSWAFKESPLKLTLGQGNKTSNNNVNSDNLAMAVAQKTAADEAINSTSVMCSPVNSPDTWIYVTYVIKNNEINTYYNGKLVDAQLYNYSTDTKVYTANQFNVGSGYIGDEIESLQTNTHTDAAMAAGYSDQMEGLGYSSYSNGKTIMELLTREDLKIHLGGLNAIAKYSADIKMVGMNVGTAYGTSIDDLAFYDVAMDGEQVAALYAKASKAEERDISKAKVAGYTFDADTDLSGMAVSSNAGTNNSVTDPAVIEDVSKGSVLHLAKNKLKETSAVKLNNPFKNNRDMTGATISYWVKEEESDGAINPSPTVVFYDEPQVMEHEKLADAYQGKTASTALVTYTGGQTLFQQGYSDKNLASSMGNNFLHGVDVTATLTDTAWHNYTIVIMNAEIKVYKDGELVANANDQNPGGRFYDGYYNKMNDFKSGTILDGDPKVLIDKTIFGGTNNAGATSILSFLTNEATEVYLAYLPARGSTTSYDAAYEVFIDDVDFYTLALTAEEVKALYEDAKAAMEGVKVLLGDADNSGTVDTDDAVEILKDSVGLSEITGDAVYAADVNGDGNVDTDDAVEILKFAVSLDVDYAIGETVTVVPKKEEVPEPVVPDVSGEAVDAVE